MTKQLRKLIEQQTADDDQKRNRVEYIRGRKVERMIKEPVDRRVSTYEMHLLEGRRAWSAQEHWDARGGGICPVCQSRPLERNEYCTGCDRAGFDDESWWKRLGLPVGSRMVEGYVDDEPETAIPTKYEPDSKLRGGLKG